MKQTFTKNALIWFLLTILLSHSSLFHSLSLFLCNRSSLSLFFQFSSLDVLMSWRGLSPSPTFTLIPRGMRMKVRRVASVELLSFLDYLFSFSLLFSLSHSLTLLTFSFKRLWEKIFPILQRSSGLQLFQAQWLWFCSYQWPFHHFPNCDGLHFISFHFLGRRETGNVFVSTCSRLSRPTLNYSLSIRPSSNWIRRITRIASHSFKNLMKPDTGWEQKQLP